MSLAEDRYAHQEGNNDENNRQVHPQEDFPSQGKSLIGAYFTDNPLLREIVKLVVYSGEYAHGKVPYRDIQYNLMYSKKDVLNALKEDPDGLKKHGIEIIFEKK